MTWPLTRAAALTGVALALGAALSACGGPAPVTAPAPTIAETVASTPAPEVTAEPTVAAWAPTLIRDSLFTVAGGELLEAAQPVALDTVSGWYATMRLPADASRTLVRDGFAAQLTALGLTVTLTDLPEGSLAVSGVGVVNAFTQRYDIQVAGPSSPTPDLVAITAASDPAPTPSPAPEPSGAPATSGSAAAVTPAPAVTP